MKQLIAKPIIQDQYWVVTDGEEKVGNVIADGTEYQVLLNGQNSRFKATDDITKTYKITFEKIKLTNKKTDLLYSEFPTAGKVYNSIFDIKKRIHLYTKSLKSKCYYAAGWYVIKQSQNIEVIFCPKYIFIQRYDYVGPYKSKSEAEAQINKL